MTAPAPKLGDLLERLEAATGPNRRLDDDIDALLYPDGDFPDDPLPAYTADLNAVLALVGERLPGLRVWLNQLPVDTGLGWEGLIWSDENGVLCAAPSRAPTPSLALLKALVSALSSESALSGSDQVEDRTATPGGQIPIPQPLKETP